MRLLVLLQNKYDKGELARGYAPGRWRRELATSRTGRRLRVVIDDLRGWKLHYSNACPGVHAGPDSRPAICLRHVGRALAQARPDLVLACGKVAEAAALETWAGPLIAIPHPASRVLTDRTLRYTGVLLDDWRVRDKWAGLANIVHRDPLRIALRQRRGFHEIEDLP